jgi:uncharacterized protein (DUF433 family)
MSGITRRPETMDGAYCLAGTRMPVVQVKRIIAEAGIDWLKREFPWITDAQIETAQSFRNPSNEGGARG